MVRQVNGDKEALEHPTITVPTRGGQEVSLIMEQ